MQSVDHFLEVDEVYPSENYDGLPEWALFDVNNYEGGADNNNKPAITLSTNMEINELSPLPAEFSYNY